jgi:hypothetical protein
VAGLIASLLVTGTLALGADDALSICPLVLQEERNELEDLRLNAALIETELVAAEQIFELLDGLWKADAVARLIYLTGKHDRDAAKLRKERATLLVAREEALMEQLDLLCTEQSADDLSAAQRERYDRAHAAYLKADCDRRATEVALAEVDLAYRQELLDSALDLRENDVATRQDVIRAERDVAMARKRLDEGNRRVNRCQKGLSRPGAAQHP